MSFGTLVSKPKEAEAVWSGVCLSAMTGLEGNWTVGSTKRWTHNVGSSDVEFKLVTQGSCNTIRPGGSDMNFGMRLYFCGPGTYSTERHWLGASVSGGPVYTNTPATGVQPNTCFQLAWRARNLATQSDTWKGMLWWEA